MTASESSDVRSRGSFSAHITKVELWNGDPMLAMYAAADGGLNWPMVADSWNKYTVKWQWLLVLLYCHIVHICPLLCLGLAIVWLRRIKWFIIYRVYYYLQNRSKKTKPLYFFHNTVAVSECHFLGLNIIAFHGGVCNDDFIANSLPTVTVE